MLLRELGNGESEVTTLSWWTSMDAIRALAGATPELARYYPEDDRYLLHRPCTSSTLVCSEGGCIIRCTDGADMIAHRTPPT